MAQVTNDNNHLAHPSSYTVNETHFLARSVGLLALLTGLVYLRALSTEGLLNPESGQGWAGAMLLFGLITTATLSVLCAWRWEVLGGVVAILCAVGIAFLAYQTFPEHPLFTAFAYSSPFLITGALFLACRRRRRPVT